MQPSQIFLWLLVGASTAQADGAAISGAVDSVREAALSFSVVVTNWDGQLITAMPVSNAAGKILESLLEAKKVAEDSKKMSIREALGVRDAFHRLITNVTTTTDVLIEAKPKFFGAWLKGSVLLGLRKNQAAAGLFAVSVLKKVPSAGQPLGRKLGRKINEQFTRSIDAYKGNR